MTDRQVILELLSDLSGRKIRYQGLSCRVAELLVDPPALVLEVLEGPGEILADSYGHPRRKGPRLIELEVWREDGSLNPELKLLSSGDRGG